jgi:hypothetical protein
VRIVSLAPGLCNQFLLFVLGLLVDSFAGWGRNQFGCIRNLGIRVTWVNDGSMQVCNHCRCPNDTLSSFPSVFPEGKHIILSRCLRIQEKAITFVGVRSRGGPKPTSESMQRVPNLDGDTRRVHGGLSWFGQKKALRPAGRGEYCISLHLSACVGVTSCERGNRAQVSEKNREYKGDCLRC